MASTSLPPPPISTLGALQIGVYITLFLFGIVTVQAYFYFSNFPNDRWPPRMLVTIVWFAELGQAVSICHISYKYTILEFGDLSRIRRPPVTLASAAFFSGTAASLVQAYLTWRIYRFLQKLFIPCFLWLLCFLRFAGDVVVMVYTLKTHHKLKTIHSLPAEYRTQWRWLITSILILGAVTDVAIAIVLSFHLRQRGRQTLSRSTRFLVNTLVIWSLKTGTLTSLFAIIKMILFLTMNESFIWLAFFAVLSKTYSCSLLTILNGRKHLRESSRFANVEMGPSRIQFATAPPTSPISTSNTSSIEEGIRHQQQAPRHHIMSFPTSPLADRLRKNDIQSQSTATSESA